MNIQPTHKLIGVMTAALLTFGQAESASLAGAQSPESKPDTGHEIHIIKNNYVENLMRQGQTVYRQLVEARQATLKRDLNASRAALDRARAALDGLDLPALVRALDHRLGILQNNLNSSAGQLDSGLWVPVKAELASALVFASDGVKAQAARLSEQGRTRAAANDSQGTGVIIDKLVHLSEYNLGAFPLTSIKTDLQAARTALNQPQPLWSAALEAVQTAIGRFHWYTEEPAQKLLSAYSDVVGAYALASAPRFRDDQQQAVINQLIAARKKLNQLADARSLSAETRMLIDTAGPTETDIKTLLQDFQREIHIRRRESMEHIMAQVTIDLH